MILLLPMAGKGARFAGYDVPKPLLPIGNNPLFIHIIDRWEWLIDRVIILYNPDQDNPYLQTSDNWELIAAPNTKSPLETLSLACPLLTDNTPVLVNYVDCWITDPQLFLAHAKHQEERGCSAFLASFFSHQSRFTPLGRGLPGMVAGGVARFASAKDFAQKVNELPHTEGSVEIGMPNVAEAMQCAYWFCEHGRTYIDVGTPDDYSRFLRGWRK